MTVYASETTTPPTDDADLTPETPDAPAEQPTQPDPGTELEVVDAKTLPAVQDPTAPDAPAKPKWVHQSPWAYDWLDFKGDRLAIRVPKGAALVGLQFSRYSSEDAQEQAFGRFISRHVSDETFNRLLDRMGDPDEQEYDTTVLGELAAELGRIAGERIAKDAKALEDVKSGRNS